MKTCYSCFSELPDGAKTCPRCGCSADLRNEDKYPHALPCGTVLNGRYIVGRVLGQGGFGITYVGQEFNTKKLVAVKEYYPDTMASRNSFSPFVVPYNTDRSGDFEYGRTQFLQEARTLAALKGNPDIVRIYSFFEENGTAYFVMEYVRGKNLKKYIEDRGGRVSWEEAWKLLLPVLDALTEVHSKNIIHRDIKPDNILITEGGRARLIDFGAARYSCGEKSQSLTAVLTPGYAPVEQYFRRGKQGPWTDVYALAATLYFCITGEIPVDSVERSVRDTLKKPSGAGAAIPEYAEQALLKALAVKEDDRFRTTRDFRAAVLERGRPTKPDTERNLKRERPKGEGEKEETRTEPLKNAGYKRDNSKTVRQADSQGKEHKKEHKEWNNERDSKGKKEDGRKKNRQNITVQNRSGAKEKGGSGKAGILLLLVLLAAGCWFYNNRSKDTADSASEKVSSDQARVQTSSSSGALSSGEGPSQEELDKLSFCKDLFKEYTAGFDELAVDYSADSLEDIAASFQAAGWSFLPTDNWGDLSLASEQIPSMDGILTDARLLNAVYFLDEGKACRVRIVEFEENEDKESGKAGYSRSIELRGDVDLSGILFSSEKGDLEKQQKDWLEQAAETQKKALAGFFPSSIIETIDQKTFSDIGFTSELVRDLRRVTEKYSNYNILSWDERSWEVYSSVDDGVSADEATPRDMTYFYVKHDSKKVTFSRWSEETLHQIQYYVEPGTPASTD